MKQNRSINKGEDWLEIVRGLFQCGVYDRKKVVGPILRRSCIILLGIVFAAVFVALFLITGGTVGNLKGAYFNAGFYFRQEKSYIL